jgi:hypothetical protein
VVAINGTSVVGMSMMDASMLISASMLLTMAVKPKAELDAEPESELDVPSEHVCVANGAYLLPCCSAAVKCALLLLRSYKVALLLCCYAAMLLCCCAASAASADLKLLFCCNAAVKVLALPYTLLHRVHVLALL